MTTLLIAGTDTDVGKTFVTIALAAYWQQYQYQEFNNNSLLSIFKLMQTGTGDGELYQQLFAETPGIEVIVPLRLSTPVAPPIAAAKEGKVIELAKIWQEFCTSQQKSDLVLLETLGGLGSPVTDELIVGNIAADWRLPTVLIVPVKLGAIANVVANVALARSLKIDLKGIILNCSDPEAEATINDLTPVDLIQSLTQIPIIGILPYIHDVTDSSKLASIAANWDLELILPKPKVSYR
jgi:dethiobiotin synthetase